MHLARSRRRRASIPALLAVAMLLVAALPARAVNLIRDPDIEHALTRLAAPVLRAAGLDPGRVRILMVDDASLNAFVLGGDAIFLHTGLILKMERAAQLQSVIAHEAAHIANGHMARRQANLGTARNAAGFGMALAAAVAISTGQADAAAGVAAGANGSAMRRFFAHTRAEESAADQSSIRYMLRAGVDPAGAVEVLDIFRGQEALSIGRQDPYARTHPLTSARLRAMRGLVAANPGDGTGDAQFDYWFARAHGKLSAFTRNPGWTLRRVRDDDSQTGRMRRAIALHRQADAAGAIREMQALVAAHPDDPYLYELFGQILLESRRFSAAAQAYRNASALAPDNALILGGLGRSLLTLDGADAAARAVQVLERARARDFRDGRILRDLGQAYARSGQPGLASLATAERYALAGRMQDARVHATRAVDRLPRGSAAWRRAQDVLDAARN
ncbi:MAG: M48 family metalloprotease [Alphaproteobacteria bacterium]|jgi:predicted Zn-dependent protease|nr:M48 family metalloprotease [Alphaproteobacteria bacterium]